MKLYKKTLIISVIVFSVSVILSIVFEFTCISKFRAVSFLLDYMIGIACSSIVVIITTLLQFMYEQKKLINSIISGIQILFFHCWGGAMALTSPEEVPCTLWKNYCEEIYEELRKISKDLSGIEWFSKKQNKKMIDLHRAVLGMMVETINFSNYKDIVLNAINNPLLDEIKENTVFLASENDSRIKEIFQKHTNIKQELENTEVSI